MANCQLCGDPMPPGEEMFNYHGYSGPCPKPPLKRDKPRVLDSPSAVFEECAKIAEEYAPADPTDSRFAGATEAARRITEAIRARAKEAGFHLQK